MRAPSPGRPSLGGFDCGGLALGSPSLSAFPRDQRPTTDLHRGRSPSLALHLVKKVFADGVQNADRLDREGERVRVRVRWLALVFRTIIERRAAIVAKRCTIRGRRRLLAGNFWTRHPPLLRSNLMADDMAAGNC